MRTLLISLIFYGSFNTLSAAEPTRPPHILFIYADDLGVGDLSCYGGQVVPTPQLDRMAKEGVRFTKYYSASPICSPSRCGLITGQYPSRWNITSYLQTRKGNAECEMADFLSAKAPSLPRILKEAGYKTAHFGKWHLGGGRDVVNPPKFAAYGYDENAGTWESPEPHPDITATDWIWSDKDKVKRWERTAFFFDKTVDFLKRHSDQPCFVNIWLDDPHTPWVPSANAPKGATKENLRGVMIENDKQIGRLIDAIDQMGHSKNTLIIFTSDNGPAPTFDGERTTGLRGSKLSLYEGGIRLPFIARWTGTIPAGKVDDTTMLSACDMLPTLAKLGQAKLPADYVSDGQEQTAALLGTPNPKREKPLFWEYGRNPTSFKYPGPKQDRSPNVAMLDGHWKLLVNADGSNVELYNLKSDPNETKNLAEIETERTFQMKKQTLAWRQSLPQLKPKSPKE